MSGPGNVHSADDVLLAIDSEHLCSQVAVVLKKVEMPLGELLEIIGLAQLAAVWAWNLEPLSALTRICSS